MTTCAAATIDEVIDAVRSLPRVRVVGGGTKSALSTGASLSVSHFSGVLSYEPSEYTFTARAGTPLTEVRKMLDEHGQFLPFDPPLIQAGATLGGTVAAGLSGPGRFRFGGIRDFLLGVRMITGTGRVVFGGGKVVKNAAGFDIPKLMVGALGTLGVLVELTFKVFPKPESYATVCFDCKDFADSMQLMNQLATSQAELACLDFLPPNRVMARVGGLASALSKRVDGIIRLCQRQRDTVVNKENDQPVWNEAREFTWLPNGDSLIKVPISPHEIELVEQFLQSISSDRVRRYSVGGNVVWIGWNKDQSFDQLDHFCRELNRPALVVIGDSARRWLGRPADPIFSEQLLSVFDPKGKFQ